MTLISHVLPRGAADTGFDLNQLPYLLGLSNAEGIGPIISRNLIAYCGSPEAIFSTPKGKLLRIPGIGPKVVDVLKASAPNDRIQRELEFCSKNDIEVIPYYSRRYPENLKNTFGAPLILFKKGNLNLGDRPSIGIVGTRKPTDNGREIAHSFAKYFAEKGFNVVSGLAYGIDISAHTGALDCGGVTTGILGHGLDRIYPMPHSRQAEEMLENGCLITEFFSGTKPGAKNFPARNRIISGLCRAVIVIEANEKGGALITAKMAFEYNREVYAIPGDLNKPTSKGCNNLIRQNIAKLITCPSQVLDDLDFSIQDEHPMPARTKRKLSQVLSKDERKVLKVVENSRCDFDEISRQSGLRPSKLNPLLLAMEFKGLISQGAGKMFIAS